MPITHSVKTVGSESRIVVLTVEGYVDTDAAFQMEEVLGSILEQRKYPMVIDLKVTYINSSGWRVFISKIKDIAGNRNRIKISGMSPAVLDVFTLLGFQHILESYATADDAVAAFRSQVSTGA
jgi:anti-anti-sigma factor